jgi:hypothetical protein
MLTLAIIKIINNVNKTTTGSNHYLAEPLCAHAERDGRRIMVVEGSYDKLE